MNNYVLTQEQGDKIIAYLVTQPYRDVSGLIVTLQTLTPVTIQQEQPKDEPAPISQKTEELPLP